ncbi:MAG: DUF952 domain-containing protein [Alphaproteobacteria bacterium]|nr:DUF952 domain-containing protein [Alphaproteobacteria bacterium]
MALVFKIVPAALWRAAERAGIFTGASVDRRDGFIHLSSAAQVVETAARHFAGQADLLLAAFDGIALGPALQWEESHGGALFPHLYGALEPRAARWVRLLPLGADGKHVFPPLDGTEK